MVEKFFIGNTAYGLQSFPLTPYDNAVHGTTEDDYNYLHLSSRILVECAFGEIDLRWGIFWKPLKFSLHVNNKIIDVCMRLHNFIIDQRTDRFLEAMDRDVFDDDCRHFFAVNPLRRQRCLSGCRGKSLTRRATISCRS